MDIKDVTGLGEPLKKLIETVSNGVGVAGNDIFEFDVKKIKRIGKAEAEVEKAKIIKKAEGEEKALEILGRAEKRFALEQYTKQINLENIVVKTKEKLEGQKVSDEPVDKDWSFRFMNIAQDVSREDMQDLLSKILAEEIKKPSTFSLRTLDFVKNLSKDDLILFRKFALMSDKNGYIHVTDNNMNDGFSLIRYGEIMEIIEIGLVQPSMNTVYKFGDVKKDKLFPLILNNTLYKFKYSKDINDLRLPILNLSLVGSEIVNLFEFESSDEEFLNKYIRNLKEFWITKNIIYIE